MVEPVLASQVESYLATISLGHSWKHWYLLPAGLYVVKWNKVRGQQIDGTVHLADCRYAQKRTDSLRVRWEEVNPELVLYWWASAIEESPRKAGKTSPELKGFVKFCNCTAVKPHYQKAREIYERAHPRPD